MSDELKAAKERLRRIRNHDSITSVYDFPGRKLTIQQQWQLDCELLADAYLAEHHADDDEPLTNDWLHGLGHLPFLCIWINLDGGWVSWTWNGQRMGTLDHVKTRGDVRRLCEALGIELKESD